MAKAVKAAVIVAGIATGVGVLTGAIAGGGAFSLLGVAYEAGTISAFFARQFVTGVVLGALSGAMAKKPSTSNAAPNTLSKPFIIRPLIQHEDAKPQTLSVAEPLQCQSHCLDICGCAWMS